MLPSEDTGSEYNANMKRKQKSDNKGTRKRAAPSMNIAKDSEVIVTSENYKKKIDEQIGKFSLLLTHLLIMSSMLSL